MAPAPMGEIAVADEPGVVRLPAFVKGEMLFPPPIDFDTLSEAARPWARSPGGPMAFRHEDLQVVREPALAGDRPCRYLVFPRPRAECLVERDVARLSSTLFSLSVQDVLDYAAALAAALEASRPAVTEAVRLVGAGPLLDPRLVELTFDLLPALLDPGPLGAAVDRELSADGRRGRDFLDGWVEIPVESTRGMTARIGDSVLGATAGRERLRPSLRAVPTRQLHVTAGNSPLLPLVSFLRGFVTKGACVVKSPAEACLVGAVVAAGMRAVDPHHPITRHTSLLYWPGGDREIEDVLLAPGAFDRVVVWGSAETVRSVRQRAPLTKTVALNPRYGVSLIGREAFAAELDEVAARATVDTLVWEQQACTASLVHYVEADESGALAYARAVARTLARWDERRRRPLPRAAQGRLRLLRRGEWVGGTWFQNTTGGEIGSAVVYMPGAVDLSLHPMSRLVVVRRVDRLEDVVPLLSAAVAATGVFPDRAVARLRDPLAAAGVSNIFPLGECERAYPGMPHDGMRVLSELVSWTNSGATL
jgi:hypothetical protein